MNSLPLWDICANNHGGQDTSIQANPSRQSKVAQQRLILEALERVGEATCEKLVDLTFSTHQSCSARLSEMLRDNKIYISGKATTRSGRGCRVYRKV